MSKTVISQVTATLAVCLLLLTPIFLSGIAVAQPPTSGFDEFRISCVSCHGEKGKGNGRMAYMLTVKPADLTTLARYNGGVFPQARIYRMIDGREAFYAHGEQLMPVWGIRYLLEHSVRYGCNHSEQAVKQRITKLVDYIRSIQK